MKKKTVISKETAKDFWQEYYAGDLLARDKALDAIVKIVADTISIKDTKLRDHALRGLLRSYFDDLIEFMESYREEKSHGNKKR